MRLIDADLMRKQIMEAGKSMEKNSIQEVDGRMLLLLLLLVDMQPTIEENVERLKPKKVIRKILDDNLHIGNSTFEAGTNTYWCPNCGNPITGTDRFCSRCGQALDWSKK